MTFAEEYAKTCSDVLAELAQTIPYEIMLGFGPRIPVEVTDQEKTK